MKNIFSLFILLLSGLSFGQVQNEYASIDNQISKMPDNLSNSTKSIASYINANFKTENEKIRAIFYWTSSKISYDINNMYAVNFNETSEEKIKKTLETKKGICINYAEIFNDIANKVGIKSIIIEGYTKQMNKVDYVPHAWCAAKIDNKWYVFDPTWGSGYVNKNKFVRKVNNYYYKTDPTKIISSHMPFDYMWQFLNYPVTNQEFYTGKTQVNKSKTYFDFATEISNYEKLSEVDKLTTSVGRMEKNGVKNAMIFDRVSGKKREIENFKQNEVVADFNNIVSIYNEGVNELNEFINYRNKQFKPVVSDEEIKKMIESPMNKLLNSQELINNLGQIDKNNKASVNSVRKSIAETLKQATEQEMFVMKYLSKSKIARKSMFYKATWLGVPLN
ncbi:transglutaminase domain-containing protein [Flavobacterium sp.]|uniref:transglutaminase domain-containing protein n=1 Tax=Flavobacterium sp. TaxID=239 RepID=UPI002B4B1D7F|nr:transglutaminase domain-containing protein [Flavobacterium sp.]HLF53364.1 transglutaminase domain-containing protein [Flavobacterium sp.]